MESETNSILVTNILRARDGVPTYYSDKAAAAVVAPLPRQAMHGPERRGEQWRHSGESGESSFGTLDVALLVEVGRCQPGRQVQGVAGRIEDHAAIDDAQSVVHAQPEALEHRGEVPWINRLAITAA